MNVPDDEVSVRRPSILPTMLVLVLLAGALGFTHSLQASTSHRTAPGCRMGDLRPLTEREQSYAVDARGLVRVYRRPDGTAFARFGALNQNGVATVFAALEAVVGPRCKAAWYRVRVPVKPNGTTGYVRARSVNLRLVRSEIVVDLSARRLTVYRRGRANFSTTTAIGGPARRIRTARTAGRRSGSPRSPKSSHSGRRAGRWPSTGRTVRRCWACRS